MNTSKPFILSIAILLSSFCSMAQTKTDRELFMYLKVNELSGYVSQYSKEQVAQNLTQFIIKNCYKSRHSWFSESALDTNWIQKDPHLHSKLVSSYVLKSTYWLDLLYHGRTPQKDRVAELQFEGEPIYDLLVTHNYKRLSVNKTAQMNKLLDHIKNWNKLLKTEGLQHLIDNDMSPLPDGYQFVRMATNWQLFEERNNNK